MRIGWAVSFFLFAIGCFWGAMESPGVSAHGSDARYVETIPWQKEHVARSLGVGRWEFGISGSRNPIEMKTIENRSCVVASLVAIDVDNAYAFDIDESVDLAITYAPEFNTPFVVAWDKNGGEGFGRTEIKPEAGATFRRVTLKLERARLAGLGFHNTDIAIGGPGGITLCDVEIVRSGMTKMPAVSGRLRLAVRDAGSKRPVPARVGLYDSTGRAPLPSDKAVQVNRFADEIRLLWLNRRIPWPSENRLAFYIDGAYEAQLPAGTYEVVVTRGPEYRAYRGAVEIRGGDTRTVSVALQRYVDLPARGWFSGDSHIHFGRERTNDRAAWAQVAGEDVHLGNLLEMGNIAGTHFKQPAWGKEGHFERDGYLVASGQEDPRSGHRGHTIHWNIEQPIHDANKYFLYHWVFDESHRQGGVSGYAHLGELFNAQRGLSLDVPFGLVDFLEVLQGGRMNTEIWYRFLNLGFKLTPAAGSDFPYFQSALPGAERTYVKLDGAFSADAWFAAFRRGRVYVTNGPLLEFAINGRQMGEELRVEPGTRLEIVAEAQLNPDVDKLSHVELLVHGEVVAKEPARGQDRVRFRTEITAQRSMWVAVRALGERQEQQHTTIAHSAPIYVIVGGQPFWKAEAVPELVEHQRQQLQGLLSTPIDPAQDLEPWETRAVLVEQWEKQLALLKPRIEEADAKYRELLNRVRNSAR